MLPKEECEVLLDALLPAAEHLLRKNGEFYPIGAVMTTDSNTTLTAVDSEHDFPDSQSVIDALISSHRQMAEKNNIKASGIAWNAAISTPDGKQSDAIMVSLEHSGDYSVVVVLPYKIGLFKRIKFGELFAQNGNHNIF